METYKIIYNPNASKGKAKKSIEKICKIFESNNIEIQLKETKCANDAFEIAKNLTYEGNKKIIAVGGDGTINEVLNGIMVASDHWELADRPCLGIIPIGRGNDFCFSAGISLDFNEAINNIIFGKTYKVDVGMAVANQEIRKYFLNGVGIGVEPMVNFKASEYKHVHGRFSYLLALVHTLIKYPKAMDLKFIIDNKVEAYSSQQVSIGNGKRMGNAFLMCPEAKIDDGKLDLVWANTPIKRRSILKFAIKFFKGTQIYEKEFFNVNIGEIIIESSQGNMPIHCDGEEITRKGKELYVTLDKQGIYLLKK